MKKMVYFILLLVAISFPFSARANNKTAQKLGVCFVDSLNGKERKELAKWMYFGMSKHSTIKRYSRVSQTDFDNMNKYIGALITRLMTEDCPSISKLAMEGNGTEILGYAFGVVGEVAMKELMNEPNVEKSLSAFDQYLDEEKFNQAFND